MSKLRVTAKNIKVSFWIDDDLKQEMHNITTLLYKSGELAGKVRSIIADHPSRDFNGTGIGHVRDWLENLDYISQGYYSRIMQYGRYGTLDQFYDMLRKYLDLLEEGISVDTEELREDIDGDKSYVSPSSDGLTYEMHQILKDMGLVFGALQQTIDNIRAIIDIPIDVEEPVYSPA